MTDIIRLFNYVMHCFQIMQTLQYTLIKKLTHLQVLRIFLFRGGVSKEYPKYKLKKLDK